MKNYLLNQIPIDKFFSETVYLDKNFILAAPEMSITEKIISILREWEFKEIYSNGKILDDYAADKVSEIEGIESSEATMISDHDKIINAEEFYTSFEKYVETLFTRVSIKNEIDYNSIAEKIKISCEIIKEDRRYLLRVQKKPAANPNSNYLVSHSVKTTIVSIIIGLFLKLPNHRLIELGISALLHDIGMIKVPPQIYLSNRPLNVNERRAIMTHPLLGFNMLKAFDFPLNISLGALEHHERENGSGYPQKLTGDKISLYAKIIAVACSYDALSTKRPHKEAKDGYTGMLELLKNEGKQYDDTIVRALVFSLSIYPIGLYVLLSSGRNGQVVDVNPENPRFPIVQVFGELTPDGKNKVIETSQEGIYIIRPLTREETEAN